MDGFRDEQHTTDWSFDGVYTRYHKHSYVNGDRCSSTNTSEFPPINRPRLVKIVSFWLTLLLVGLICAIIYLAHIRETKTRYYISHGKLAILQEYTTALGNKDSMEYKSLTASFCNEMDKSFRGSRSHTNTYRMCIVTNLRPGSVIVTFTLYFDATVDLSDTEVITTINNSVQHIGSKNMLGNYPIDINGLSVTTTLTLYEQDPIPFLEPDSDFIIPPTTKQTTTAATSTSTSPETVTTAISPADTTETKKTTTSSTETTKVKTVMTQPTTKTTKSTTTTPMTTTAKTTTNTHTEAITSTNTISLTSTTEQKTTTTLPPTVTTKLTTTIPLTTTSEGTTSSQTSPITTITSSLAPTVTSKPTTTIGLPTTTQDTKTTTFVPTITTEATTSTNLPPSSTTKATTLTPFTSSTEAKTTTIMSLITTVASTSLSPTTETKSTTTEAKRTTTLSPSTTTDQTTMTMTPTVTSEVTTTATGSPVVTTEESREQLTTKPPTKLNETTVSATLTTTKAAITISTNITSNTSTTIPAVNETTETLTTLPPTKTTEAKMSTTLPTTVNTREETSMSSTLTGNSTTISFNESTGTTTDMPSPETTDVLTTITPIKTAKTTVSNTSPTTKEDTTISTDTTSNMSTTISVKETTEATMPPTAETEATISAALQTTKETTSMSSSTTSKTTFPLEKTTEALTTMPLTEKTEAEVHSSLPTTETSVVATGMPSTLTGDTTTLSLMETTRTSTLPTIFMSTESHGASTMSEIITTVPSGPMSTNTDISVETTLGSTSVSVKNNILSSNDTTMPTDSSAESSLDSTTTVETSSIISHTVSDNATAEPTVLPTSDISTLISTEETTVTNTTKEATTSKDTTEATATNTTIEDTTREVTTEATTASTTAAAATNITREDITTALFANTTKDVTTENTITMTTGEFTNDVTINTTEPAVTNTTREYTTETAVTNTTIEDTTVVNSSWDTTGTSSIATTVSPFTADVMFPSKNIFAREDTTLECVITVTDQWEKVTINQEIEKDFVFLAEFYNNGSVFSQVTTEFLSVVFKQNNETIETIIYINIQNSSSCPSLLHLGCGIIMEDTFKSVITKTSILSITAPVHNVTLDMANVYYSGERLELICRTITDFEYGDVALEVRSPNGSVFREPAPRTKYASTKNSDCSVNFEWKFKSRISLDSSLNGSTVRCIASNRLLNTSVSTSQLITVLVSDVSFSQYYVPGSVGKQVIIECKTTTLTSNIAKMTVYKTLNGTNETIASYSSGKTNSRSDISVTFQGGMLTLTFFSLKCSDEGRYICVVTTGSLEVSTPLSLSLQPTVLAGSTAVSLSLNTDIVENYYRYTSEHSCTGEIGYPDAGFLSLTAIHPTSGATVVYNEEVVTDIMKIKDTLVGSDIYSYGVTLAKDFRILIREDQKVQENCSTIHKMRFFLNVSREWSRGRFRCEIRTKEGRIPTSLQEEQFYVIPSDACDAYNKTKQVFIDHEKNDNCNTYIQCGDEAPYGKKCSNPKHCVFIGKDYCDECVRAICTEIPTTTARSVPTTEAARGFSYLDCNSSSVSEGESASIGCHLNSSSFVSLNISRSDFTIASIQVDGSVVISPNYQGKLSAILDPASLLLEVTINFVTCSDDGIYNITLQLDTGNVTTTTFKINMKVKPKNPMLTLNPNLVDGENSLSHSCTGYVGNPPGSLQIQIRRSTDSNFTEYSTPRQMKSSSLVNFGNCSYVKTLNFSIDLTTDSWSNVTIRCVALNTVSLEDNDPVPSSILYSRTSISNEFCENKTATYYDYHPMGCPFYVWCVTGRPYGQECSANNLCMNPVLGRSNVIAFHAYLSKSEASPSLHHTLIYDTVMTNVGGSYNHHDRVFTAPVSGVYVFNWSTYSGFNSDIYTVFMVNSDQKRGTRSDSLSVREDHTSSGCAVVEITQGDIVFIRTHPTSSSTGQIISYPGFYESSFSGWLLH